MSATPFTVTSSAYGTFASTYSWYVQWYQYPTNTSTFSSDLSVTIDDFYVSGENLYVKLTFLNTDKISRVGTSGYTAPTFTYETTPKIILINDNLEEKIDLYQATISADVAAGGSGNTTTGSIIHTNTLDLVLPLSWIESGNRTWRVNVTNIVNIITTTVKSSYIGNVSLDIELPIFYEIRFDSNGYLGDAVPNEIIVGVDSKKSSQAKKENSFYGSFSNTAASEKDNYTFNHETLSYLDYVKDEYETIGERIVRVFTYATRNITKTFPIIWKDNNNQFERRPSEVIINTYTNGVLAKTGLAPASDTLVTESVPATDYLGNEISYSCDYEVQNYQAENGTTLRGLITPYKGSSRLTSLLIGAEEKLVYLGELLFNFEKIKWLLTETGNPNSTVDYIWDDNAEWDDSLFWTENDQIGDD